MSPNFRSAVLAVLVLVFFLFGGAAVLYAQGWRVKFSPLTASKVGGIYARAYPSDAEIYVNGEKISRSAGLFEKGILAGNLFPGNYELLIRKTGFRDWKTVLPVEPSLVTSKTHVILFPESPVLATSGISRLSGFGNSIILTAQNRKLYWNGAQIPGDTAIASLGDGEAVITKAKDGYYLTDGEAATSTNITRTLPRLNLPARSSSTIIGVPGNGISFLIWASSSLRLANPVTGRPTSLEDNSKDISAVAANASRIAWTKFDAAKKVSYISVYDLPSETFLPNTDLVPGRTLSMLFTGRNTVTLLQDDGSLFTLAPGEGSRIRIGKNVHAFTYSESGGSLAFADDKGLNITSGSRDYIFLNVEDPASITSLVWTKDGFHLLLRYPQKTVFLDTEDTALNNLIEVAPTPNVIYSAASNTLSFLEGDTLQTFALPQ